MSDRYQAGRKDDMREHMFALRPARGPFALATIAPADGGLRPVGSQMVTAVHYFRLRQNLDGDHVALVVASRSSAGHVSVLGARRRHRELKEAA